MKPRDYSSKPTPDDLHRDVFIAALPPEEPTGRCCARCKTPYNCGHTACPCHGRTRA